MFSPGKVHYEIGANTDAMSFGGIGAIHRLVTKLGLPKEIDRRLELLKVHRPYHESDHVLNLAYNVMCGGTRLEESFASRLGSLHQTDISITVRLRSTTMDRFFPHNEGTVDRVLRVTVGLVLLSLVFFGPQTIWGLVGIVPLATGLLGSCPVYTLLGISTCPMKTRTS